MIPLVAVAYIVISSLLAFLGRDTRAGPIMIFLISILMTPILPAIYILVVRLERVR